MNKASNLWGKWLQVNYKFYQAESRLYDFLIFPRFLYYSEEKERTQGQSNYEEYIEPEYHHFAKKLGEQLELFREDIAPFYHSQFSNDFDFIDLLLKGTGLIGFTDEQHYLANLANLSSREIQTYILSAMLVINSECSKIKEAKDKAEQMSEDPARVRSFIKELPIEAGTKWHLSLILEDPQEYVRRYVVLMEKLLPIFKQFYEPFTKQVQAYGAYLLNIINAEGILWFQRLTSSNVNVKSLEG